MRNRIFVTLKKRFTSLADQVLHQSRKSTPPTPSQQAEKEKYEAITQLRDQKNK